MSKALLWLQPKDLTLHSGSEATGNGTIFDLEAKYGTLLVQITGITTATITFETSNDNGTTYDEVKAVNKETGRAGATATADGTFEIAVTGVKLFRARISAYTSGTIIAYATAVPATAGGANDQPAGFITTATHTAVTAAATSTVAKAANVARKYLLLVNDSDAVIYIKMGADAVVSQGIRINANGGSYEMSDSIGNLYIGAVNCISAAGSKTLLVTEGV